MPSGHKLEAHRHTHRIEPYRQGYSAESQVGSDASVSEREDVLQAVGRGADDLVEPRRRVGEGGCAGATEIVRGVVTLGSPVIGGPKYTRAAGFYRNVLKQDLDEIERSVDARNQIPIQVPLTAIYSKRDKVVQWEACIDDFNEHCEHIEVDASHLTLGFDPKVLELVSSKVREHAAKARKT